MQGPTKMTGPGPNVEWMIFAPTNARRARGVRVTQAGRGSSFPRRVCSTRGVTIASTPNDRSRGIVALIEGFFALMWFGWGQTNAPSWLSLALLVGSAVAVIVAGVGAVVAVRATGQRTAMAQREIRLRYNVIVGLEFLLIATGVVILGRTGSATLIPVWVCTVVGVHFLPLARVFPGLFLVPLAAGLLVVAVGALVAGLLTGTSPGTVVGPGAGTCLIAAAVATLLAASRDRTVPKSVLPFTNS
jgi:hypothetical protein